MTVTGTQQRKLTIVQAPFAGGQGKLGVEQGPKYMLKHGLQHDLESLGWKTSVEEAFDISEFAAREEAVEGGPVKRIKRVGAVGEAAHRVHDKVSQVAARDEFVVTLGGDHSIAVGTVTGMLTKHPDAGLLWIDAHADINTLESTESGNLHGCPVSFLLGLNDTLPESFQWLSDKQLLSSKKIAYIGLRDVDKAERVILKKKGIAAFSMYHVDRYGINKVIEMALDAVTPKDPVSGKRPPLMCSYDVDAIDPLYVPATGTPVRGGLTLREGLFLAERLAEEGNLVNLDIVECNPNLAVDDIHVANTISAGCAIARCALGESLL